MPEPDFALVPYAEGGSPEYSIVDLQNLKLEVFREPKNSEWTEHFVLGPADTIRPVAFPHVELAIGGFLMAATH